MHTHKLSICSPYRPITDTIIPQWHLSFSPLCSEVSKHIFCQITHEIRPKYPFCTFLRIFTYFTKVLVVIRSSCRHFLVEIVTSGSSNFDNDPTST